MGSNRLPGKVLRDLHGAPMLQRIVERVRRSAEIDELVIATTMKDRDDPIVALAEQLDAPCLRGSEDDVLGRVASVVRAHPADVLVCLTGDNAFADPGLIDAMVRRFVAADLIFLSTVHMQFSQYFPGDRTFPRGLSVDVTRPEVLLEVDATCDDSRMRVASTYAIYHRPDGRYRPIGFHAEGAFAEWCAPDLRITVDTPEDMALARHLYAELSPVNPAFSSLEAIRYLRRHPNWATSNQTAGSASRAEG